MANMDTKKSLDTGYNAMAGDAKREAQAQEWINGLKIRSALSRVKVVFESRAKKRAIPIQTKT